MLLPTRREFLATSAVLAAWHVSASRLSAATVISPQTTGNGLLPAQTDGQTLRTLAAQTIDAARAAGASYADVRLSEVQSVRLRFPGGVQPQVYATATVVYGVRVIVDGALAFVSGRIPTTEAMTTAARHATATARGYAKQIKQPIALVPATPLTGEWSVPVRIDPFTISIQEQTDLLGAFNNAMTRVRYGKPGTGWTWERESRVFASTAGSDLLQQFARAQRSQSGVALVGSTRIGLSVPGFEDTIGGYETVLDPTVQDRITATTEEAARLASLPATTFDVGRYPAVLDGHAASSVVLNTLAPALELDRALGYEAGLGGTSFAMPPAELMGTAMFSPQLTITNGRAAPAMTTARWDDDGVPCDTFPLIERGILVDYLTTRQTAGALSAWYERNGKAPRSHGCAVAANADQYPLVRPGHLTVAAARDAASLDDLCRAMGNGILIINSGLMVQGDQQRTSAFLSSTFSNPFFEVAHGRVVRKLVGNAVQIRTKPFWGTSLRALGGADTVGSSGTFLWKGQPAQNCPVTGCAPAIHVSTVDMVQAR